MGSTAEYVEDQLEKQRRDRLEAANRMQHDYEKSAQIFGVQAVTNLPAEVVAADLPNLLKKVKANEFDYDKYTDRINGAPAFNRFAAENQFHLSVLERDHAELPRLERAYRQMSLGWQSGWAMTEIAEIRDRQLTNFENPDRAEDKARLEQLSQLVQGGMFGADAWYSKVLVGTAQQVPIQAWLLGESLDEVAIGAGAGAVIGAVSGGGVLSLPGAASGAITGAGRGLMVGRTEAAFRLERGLAYDEYLGMGLNEEEARWAATAVGGVNAALESIGAGALTKRIPGFDKIMNDRVGGVINSVLTKPTMRQAIARASLQYGEGVATELLTEVLQESTLIAAGELLKANERGRGNVDPSMQAMTVGVPFTDSSGEFWDRVGDIAAHTLYGTVLIGGIGPTSTFIRDAGRANKAEKYGVALDVLGDAAEASETRKNAPSTYEAFVAKLAGDGNKILIEARRFIDYFQEQGMDADEVAKSVGIENLGDAEMNGLDIEIPADQYLAKIAPSQHHNGLKADIKEGPDSMSQNEAQIYRANIKLTLKEIQELAASEDPEQARIDAELIEKVKTRLVETGTSPEAADFQAQIMVGIPNLARRAGKDPQQFFEERFGGIVATTNAQMRADKEDFSPFVDPYLDKIRAGDIPAQREIFGPSLIEAMRARGGIAMDAEIDARDLKKLTRGLIREGGDTLDGAAEIAHEQGYIAERDPQLLLEALEAEAAGDPVFGSAFDVDSNKQELRDRLEELANILDQNGIDIQDMTNAQVRAAMEALDTYHQDDTKIDTEPMNDMGDFVFLSAEHDPQMLARAAAMLPDIAPIQEFGDIQFSDEVTIKGKKMLHTRSANAEFRRATMRKTLLEKLKDCLGG